MNQSGPISVPVLRHGLVLVLTVGLLAPALCAQLTPLEQQLPLRVNCGDLNGYGSNEPGYQLLGPTSPLTWASLTPPPPASAVVHVAKLSSAGAVVIPSDVFTIDPDEIVKTYKLTSLKLTNPTQLRITGLGSSRPYRIMLELGALSPWVDVNGTVPSFGGSTVSTRMTVEESVGPDAWRVLARDIRCTAGYATSSFASVAGSIVPVWTLAHSDSAGNIVLRFSSGTTEPPFLAGFEVHAFEALPVVYHHGAQGPLVTTAPSLQPFVNEFNAHDFVQARLALDVSPPLDPFLKGVALTHLVGWLDGSDTEGWKHIPAARTALQQVNPAAHPAAAWLLGQLDQLQRALDHLQARGYSSAFECPSAGGKGFMNPECAGQAVYEFGYGIVNPNAHVAMRLLSGLCAPAAGGTVVGDIQAWNAAPLNHAGWEPSPLVFAALKQYGVTVALTNPLLGIAKLPNSTPDPESVAFVQAFKDIFLTTPGAKGFGADGFGASEFPLDMELRLLAKYAELGTHPFLWDASLWNTAAGTAVLSDAQIDASWWGAEAAKPPVDPGAPAWAGGQRQFGSLHRNLVGWWLSNRLEGNELGGGWGDDVELLLVMYPGWSGLQRQADRRQLDGLDALIAYGLENPEIVENGYFAGPLADVEHTGEYTSNTFQAARAVFGHSARAIGAGLGVTQHLLHVAQPFAGLTTKSRLHFKSFWMNADGPDSNPEHMIDVLLNGRAMFPGVATGFHAPFASVHLLHQDLGAWARAWRDDALDEPSTALGKPKGFLAPVQFPSNVFGNGVTWWSSNGSATDTDFLAKTQIAYELELLRMAYRRSTAADRWRYLLPAVRLFRSVMLWENQLEPAGSPGTEAWAAKLLQESPRFFALVVANANDLATDPVLTTVDDPDVPGTAPYVDPALITRMNEWVASTMLPGGVNLALQYALGSVSPCSAGPATAKNPLKVSNPYEAASRYLRGAYPLLTKHALHTDRVFINHANVLNHYAANVTGGDLQEGLAFRPAVRWITRLANAPDIAVSCNLRDLAETGYGAFAYNFGAAPVTEELQLDEGLVPGAYLVQYGPGDPKCDQFGASAMVTSHVVQKRGTGVRTTVSLQPGLNLLRVTRQGPPDALARLYDLALDPPRLEIYKHHSSLGNLPALVFKVHVVNGGSSASPPTSLNLFASVLLPDGSVLPIGGAAPDEFLVGSFAVPSLAGTGTYTTSFNDLTLPVFFNGIATAVLLNGLGIQLRAEIIADSFESDVLNNNQSRGWFLDGTPIFGSG